MCSNLFCGTNRTVNLANPDFFIQSVAQLLYGIFYVKINVSNFRPVYLGLKINTSSLNTLRILMYQQVVGANINTFSERVLYWP